MKRFVLLAIRLYQRHLSRLKGFCCAYRKHTGRASCSQLGYRAVRRVGMAGGIQVLSVRLYLCGVAHRRFASALVRPPLAQRGDCDLGGCDAPSDCNCDLPGDCGNGGEGGKRKKKDEKQVHLPPDANARLRGRAAAG